MTTADATAPTITCEREGCGRDATMFAVARAAIHAYAKSQREAREGRAYDFSDLESIPSAARWEITCRDHFMGDDVADYTYSVDSTVKGRVGALWHIGEKEWVGELTDWASLATRLLAPGVRPY